MTRQTEALTDALGTVSRRLADETNALILCRTNGWRHDEAECERRITDLRTVKARIVARLEAAQ